MRNHYSKQQWRQFRSEIIELDGGRCRLCGREQAQGAILQVHHKAYFPNKMPWEYQYSDCETLCKGCHAAQHGKFRPLVGWDCLYEEDLGDLSGTCEHCETAIRHIFHIWHANWEPIEVGTVCCDKLTGTTTASDHIEILTRMKRFVSSPRWKKDKYDKYGSSINQKNIRVEIFAMPNDFQIRMDGQTGKQIFATEQEAKKKAFEVIDSGEAEEYLRRTAHRRESHRPPS